MRYLLFILSFFLSISLFSQDAAPALAEKLIQGKKNELEKVTAIFKWITGNISYKTKNGYRVIDKNLQRAEIFFEKEDSLIKPLNLLVAETVLQRREAVCDGYSRLFATLCELAGIRSEVIVGYARTGSNKPSKGFGVNHYWNAVMIEGKWHLLDVTWASGYLSRQGDIFIRDFDEKYFLAKPEEFIQDHFPDDPRWTLLPDLKIPEEFRYSPFRHRAYNKYNFISYTPSTGIINAYIGDTISLNLETAIADGRSISPSELTDTSLYHYSDTWVFLKPESEGVVPHLPRKCSYTFTVSSPVTQWVYLLYNDDVVLRYKINVRNRGIGSTASL
jgi:Transglutaminase-like superfamily